MDCALDYCVRPNCFCPDYLAAETRGTVVKVFSKGGRRTHSIVGLWLLLTIPPAFAQLQIGDDLKMKVGALFTAGYQEVYGSGNEIQSSHGLDFGLNGNIIGSYYNPNFLSF